MPTTSSNFGRTTSSGINDMTTSNYYRTVSSNDVVGLNVAGIPAIKLAIQAFVKGYSSNYSNISSTSVNIQKAIRGFNSEKQIRKLFDSINENINASLNKLNTFANQLDSVKSSYQKADSNNTSIDIFSSKIKNR